jgi:Uma2 family endonuclease
MLVATPLQDPGLSGEGLPRKRFSREEVDRLLDAGFFDGQRYELIDGDLIDKMGQNPKHAFAIRLVLKWLLGFLEVDQVQVQLPIEAAGEDRDRSLPEPDLAVLAELKPAHRQRHPRGDELLLVVEITDTSAAFDLGRKAVLYARSGVPEYWVLDRTRGMLVVHRQLDGNQYRNIHLYSHEDAVAFDGHEETVLVRDLLPDQSIA